MGCHTNCRCRKATCRKATCRKRTCRSVPGAQDRSVFHNLFHDDAATAAQRHARAVAFHMPVSPVEASPPRAAGSAAFEAAIFAAPIDRRSRNTPSACEMPKPQFAGQMRHRTAGLCWTVASVGLPRPKRRCERQKTAEQCAGGQAHEVNSVFSANASGAAVFRKPRFRKPRRTS